MTLRLDLPIDRTFESHAGAIISDDGLYRYQLTRAWAMGPRLVVCLLNPSKADAEQPDPTLNRGVAFAKRWGFGRLTYVNLFAYRSPEPTILTRVADPVGPENDAYIRAAIAEAHLFLVAWGARGGLHNRDRDVLAMVRAAGVTPHCLRVTKEGFPEHLLYLPGDLKPKPYIGRPR